MASRRALLGGVQAGGGLARVAVHLDLPELPTRHVSLSERDLRMPQIERAMALEDGASLRLADGTVLYTGHRCVRDGARVALITIAGLLRFDVHPRADCFSFTVRNLTGLPATGPARELPVRPYHRPEGLPLNEYELRLSAPDGRDVCIIVRVPPYLGALECDYSAVALVRPARGRPLDAPDRHARPRSRTSTSPMTASCRACAVACIRCPTARRSCSSRSASGPSCHRRASSPSSAATCSSATPSRRTPARTSPTALAALAPAFEIGGRVVLRTAAHPAPRPGLVDVVLGREIGFGTGAHPTTRHCVELLLDVEPRGAFADLGCGAGALTIAAAKLGFAPVVGVDVLDRVCETAWRNGEANGVDADFVTGDLLALDRLDVRVAAMNVSELDVHLRLAATPLPELEWLIASGLDDPAQFAHAVAAYEAAGLRERRRIDAHGWPAILLAR